MAVDRLSPREQVAIPSLHKKSAEVRRSAQDTIRATQEHLLRAEAVVTASTVLIDRARATLEKLAKKRAQRAHPQENSQNEEDEI